MLHATFLGPKLLHATCWGPNMLHATLLGPKLLHATNIWQEFLQMKLLGAAVISCLLAASAGPTQGVLATDASRGFRKKNIKLGLDCWLGLLCSP